jgi:hypothetical protein
MSFDEAKDKLKKDLVLNKQNDLIDKLTKEYDVEVKK